MGVNKWIKCTPDTMPKVRQKVLCLCRTGIVDVLHLTDEHKWCSDDDTHYKVGFVLAWRHKNETVR